ncbi:hypothetical protein BJ165DRAFT_152306 [Panaeolus papilionaceus]|nr:hypothetical protein BJ165DRAFT_152306 [Panaeolus papilionaceus]
MPTKVVIYDDRSTTIKWFREWSLDRGAGEYDGTVTSSTAEKAQAAFKFKGTSVTVYGTLTPQSGSYDFSFDDDPHWSTRNPPRPPTIEYRVPLYSYSGFSGRNSHILWVNNNDRGSSLKIDYFEVTELTDEPQANSTPSPPPAPVLPSATLPPARDPSGASLTDTTTGTIPNSPSSSSGPPGDSIVQKGGGGDDTSQTILPSSPRSSQDSAPSVSRTESGSLSDQTSSSVSPSEGGSHAGSTAVPTTSPGLSGSGGADNDSASGQRIPIGVIVGVLLVGIVTSIIMVLVMQWFTRYRAKRRSSTQVSAFPFSTTETSQNAASRIASLTDNGFQGEKDSSMTSTRSNIAHIIPSRPPFRDIEANVDAPDTDNTSLSPPRYRSLFPSDPAANALY